MAQAHLHGVGQPAVKCAVRAHRELAHLGPGCGILVGVGGVIVPDDRAGDLVVVAQFVGVALVSLVDVHAGVAGDGRLAGEGAGEQLHPGVPHLVYVEQTVGSDGVRRGQFVALDGSGVQRDNADAAVAVYGVVDDVGYGEDVVVAGIGVGRGAEVDDVVDTVSEGAVRVVQDQVTADQG